MRVNRQVQTLSICYSDLQHTLKQSVLLGAIDDVWITKPRFHV